MRSQLPIQKYVTNGKKRKLVKDEAAKICKKFDEVPAHSNEKKGLCSVDKVLKIWRERDVEQSSGADLQACDERAQRVKEQERIDTLALRTLRRGLLEQGEDVLDESESLQNKETITSVDDKATAGELYIRAGEMYNKLRAHTAEGLLHEECRQTCMDLVALRVNLRGKCQLCPWVKNIAHLPGLVDLDADGRSSSSGGGPTGGIPGEAMKTKE